MPEPGLGSTVVDLLRDWMLWADWFAIRYLIVFSVGYAALLLLSIPELWNHWRMASDEHLQRLLGSEAVPPISLLVPAHNEEVTIRDSLLSFLTIEYPNLEVVVVNDGSKDRTMQVIIDQFELYQVPPAFSVSVPSKPVKAYYRSRLHSRLLVLDKENGGKADALNAAMNAARHPFVVSVDADTIIEPDALLRLARPFLLYPNIAAVGGTIRVVNSCTVEYGRVTDARVPTTWLVGCQVIEYLRAFLFGRMGWNALGGNLIISGAFGLFRKEYLKAIGGYLTGNVTEDMELTVRLHRYLREKKIPAQLPFIPDPVAWTEVPATTDVLSRQRERWQRGLIATLWKHRDMLFNRRYGIIGMLTYPWFIFAEALAPIVELLGWFVLVVGLAIGAIDLEFAYLFLGVGLGFMVLMSIWALILEEVSFKRYSHPGDFWRLLGFCVLEGVGYRQLTLWYRVKAYWNAFRGTETWGRMTRQGIGRPAAGAPEV
jgi:cellulose synthase/poly-beta-1,6-N-acetylglucosamine synthase-like glycosyltransferase